MEPDPGPVRNRRRDEVRRRHQVRRRRGMALAAVVVLVGAAAAGSALTRGDDPADETTARPTTTEPQGSPVAATGTGDTAPAGTTAAAAPLTDVVIGWAGDMVPASSAIALPSDPSVLLAGVKDVLTSPDVTMVNLEGTLTGGRRLQSKRRRLDRLLRVPLSALVRDGVQEGPASTSSTTPTTTPSTSASRATPTPGGPSGRAGLRSTGGPEEDRHGDRARRRQEIAFVGFAPYEWSGPLNDPAGGVTALVERQPHRSGADLVVVCVPRRRGRIRRAQHVPRGDETYLGEDRGDLRKFARTAINAGADLVVGSGPHVVRGIEFYKGHLIAYWPSNFVGYGGVFGLSGPTAVSYVLHARLRSDGRFLSAKIIPTLLTGQGVAEHDSSEQAITLVRSLTEADFPSSGARIAKSGAIRPPT